ncbi:MAG: DUF7669 domain-containing protein [Mycobacteriales bacterium]
MHVSSDDRPTWQLVMEVAQRLGAAGDSFRLHELVSSVEKQDPARDRGTIQPVVQGMTVNAGKGPPSPCGKPLERIGHGLYRLRDGDEAAVDRPKSLASESLAASGGRRRKGTAVRDAEVSRRFTEVIRDFETCLEDFEREGPFARSQQYAKHRATIDRRRRLGGIREALADDQFLGDLYVTLQAWGLGRRGSFLAPRAEFNDRLRCCIADLEALESLRLDDPHLDSAAVAARIWSLIQKLEVVKNKALIVANTKTLHHLLPDLVPPMDRAWTGAFFRWSAADPQSAQEATFTRTFVGFAEIAGSVQPAGYVGGGWRTSVGKLLDNAIIGYCMSHGIPPAGT